MCIAKSAGLVLCTREAGISVWRILKGKVNEETEEPEAFDGEDKEGGFERVLDMDLNVHSNLVASAISDDGKWVVVSDWYETKLFRMEISVSSLPPRYRQTLIDVTLG